MAALYHTEPDNAPHHTKHDDEEEHHTDSPSVLRYVTITGQDLDAEIARANLTLDPSHQTLQPTIAKMQKTLDDFLPRRLSAILGRRSLSVFRIFATVG